MKELVEKAWIVATSALEIGCMLVVFCVLVAAGFGLLWGVIHLVDA